jgi:hypothetical protein
MSLENSIIITNSKIIEFFNENKLLTCENFLLYYIDIYTKNKSSDETIKITSNEINNIYNEYLTILSCKKNLEKITKEIKNICYKIKSPSLENTSSKYIKVKQELHFCENCGISFPKIKGLMTHKRKCDKNKKENNKISNSVLEENSSNSNEEDVDEDENEDEDENDKL